MFVTRPFWLGYSFFLSYSVCNAAYTYWMDSTCLTPEYAPGVNKALTEIFNTCKATDAKMANALPDHLKITFHLLFGDPDGGIEDDPVLTKNVKDILSSTEDPFLGGLCSFTNSTDRATSNVRLYCDEDPQDPTLPDQRWTIVPDIVGAKVPNSKKQRIDQEFEDKLNGIRMNMGSQGCLDVGTDTEAEMHRTLSTEASPGDANPRATITICKNTLTAHTKSLSDFEGKDLGEENLIFFTDKLFTLVLWHEFMHFQPWARDDVKTGIPNCAGPFGWPCIVFLEKDQKLKNADNHAFWGLMTGLSDMGWRLSIKGEDGEDDLDVADKGTLVYDETIKAPG